MKRRKFIRKGALWLTGSAAGLNIIVPANAASIRRALLMSRQDSGGGGGGPSTAPTHVSNISGAGGGTTTCTGNGTISSGSNLILLIGVCQGNSGAAHKTISSVVWSGNGTPQNATAIPSFTVSDGNFCKIDGYYLVAPTAQVGGNITVTFATAPTLSGFVASVYSGANQTPTFSDFQSHAQTSSTTLSVTVAPGTGRIAWAATCNDGNTGITIGGTSSPSGRVEVEGISGDLSIGAGDTTSSGTITWTWAGADNGGALGAIRVDGL